VNAPLEKLLSLNTFVFNTNNTTCGLRSCPLMQA